MRAFLRSARPLPRRPFPRLPPARFASAIPHTEPDPPEDPQDDADKPRPRRTRLSAPLLKDPEPIELPDDLRILWSSEHDLASHESALPPPELFEEALNNLQITLHPQTQHRATYPTPLGSPIEPTLGLFCPIEGGEYVIDATVRELALRTGAEVLVLDTVQLAAGEWGQFGKAANSLQLPLNPLHFSSSAPPPPPSPRSPVVEEDDSSENTSQILTPSQMTLTLMPGTSMQGRTIMAASRRTAPPSRIKVFFDTLVNLPSKQDSSENHSLPLRSRPRLIYIRDFPTLAPLASTWYPHLLSAVRQRRRGPISRPSSPISNPMTIIFGMTPAIAPYASASLPSNGGNLLNAIFSRNSSPFHTQPLSRHAKSEWGEDEASEKAREKRLRERLKKWEKGDSEVFDEYARLAVNANSESGPDGKPDIVIVGPGNGSQGFLPFGSLFPILGKAPEPESMDFFFRTSMLVPQARSLHTEQGTRIARRREINELTMRMGVGAVGGCVQRERAFDVLPQTTEDTAHPPSSDQASSMWLSWGNSLESWANVCKIADRAIGNVMSSVVTREKQDKEILAPTQIPWSIVQNSWLAHKTIGDRRKLWVKEVAPPTGVDEEDQANRAQVEIDEVVERVKNDRDLDGHEQRLLPCIVDSASMTTTFSQVHLPAHTIDSVRTIVSLPLLHPQAFQQGILKEHGMSGCLLFGPPGTGKTLVVRALAKEAGCRMLMISPSDVMDLYVGEGEKLVKAVFSLARRLAPCVVFLDEIDALFGARMSMHQSGGAFAHRGVITEFMQEMDGLKSSQEDRVIVIGATNRPFDLDDAVLRRLPRRLLVDLPGEKEREEILKIMLRDEKLADDVDVQSLAKKTESFSGSDLKHLSVSAALDAVKEHVQLPWSVPQSSPQKQSTEATTEPTEPASTIDLEAAGAESPTSTHSRILHLGNFLKALKEITPSSSESLGSLAELRKWNEEFGEGNKDKKRQQVWGKGRFGFTKVGNDEPDGRVSTHTTSINTAAIR